MNGKAMLGFEEAENGNRSNQVEDDYLKDMSTKIMKESVSNDGTVSMVHGDQIHKIGEMKEIISLYEYGVKESSLDMEDIP